MNKDQNNDFRMIINTDMYMDNHFPNWNSIPRIVVYKNNLDEIINRIQKKAEKIENDNISVTTRKNNLKTILALKASELSGALQAYALDIGDQDLLNKIKLTKSEIEKLKEQEVGIKIRSIIETARNHLNELGDYGITEDYLTETASKVEEFNALIGMPRNILNTKYAAMGTLEELIKEGKNLLHNKMDNLMLRYRDTNPEFYNGYLRAREIVDL